MVNKRKFPSSVKNHNNSDCDQFAFELLLKGKYVCENKENVPYYEGGNHM